MGVFEVFRKKFGERFRVSDRDMIGGSVTVWLQFVYSKVIWQRSNIQINYNGFIENVHSTVKMYKRLSA